MQASPVASISSTDYGYRVATQDGGKTDVAFHGISAHLMKWSFDSYYFYAHDHLPADWVHAGLESVLGHVNIHDQA